MSECTHDCSTCTVDCDSKKPESFLESLNSYSSVDKVIGIVSGKGGVGKSFVTSLLASATSKSGEKTAILDADITGPSIPKAFGIKGKALGDDRGLLPSISEGGVEIMSVNLLLENDTDPVVWRGPVIAGAVKQFWTDVIWDRINYMYVDMPPGTGDVPLTVFQSLPLNGIVIVTSPQDLVTMVVEKAVNMANLMNIPIIGIVENYSYLECPDCKKKIEVFGKSKIDEVAKKFGLKVLARLPICPEYAEKVDAGEIEKIDTSIIENAVNEIKNI